MIGNLLSFEIPGITVCARDTSCSRKQVLRVQACVRARACVCLSVRAILCVCVCLFVCLSERVLHRNRTYLYDVHRACGFEGWSGVEVEDKDETNRHATRTRHARKLLMHATYPMYVCTLSVACVRGVHGIRVFMVCVHGMRTELACVAWVQFVRGLRT